VNFADLSWLLAPGLAFLIAAGSPGPATLAVAGTAMAEGRRAATALGLGLALGLAAWGALVAAGLGALILHFAPALVALRIAGGLFLLYLALKSARAAWAPGQPDALASAGSTRLFRRGVLLNLLNPKAVLAWAAVIALGVPADARAAGITAIVAVCALLGVAVYLAYAAAFSTPAVRSGYALARRRIEAALAVAFAAAGLRLLSERIAVQP
jgi:threonine/homoserine/homoserine lactone efflux protein